MNKKISKHASGLWLSIALIVCGLGGGYLLLVGMVRNSVYRAEAAKVRAYLYYWVEAGRPEGEALKQFMQRGSDGVITTNRVLSIGGTNYFTLFSLPNPNGNAGVEAFYVTTNSILISIDKNGRAQIASPPCRLCP
jgi:hypothetical protein